MKTIFRQYPDGEIIALFPQEPADDAGIQCVAFLQTGQFMPVDPEAVLANTEPAGRPKYARTLRKLNAHKMMKEAERKAEVEPTLKIERPGPSVDPDRLFRLEMNRRTFLR